MTFRFIDAERGCFPIERMCGTLSVSVSGYFAFSGHFAFSGYFAWRGRSPSWHDREDGILLMRIRSAFSMSNGTYGSPRMTRELQDEGFTVGRHQIARLMRENRQVREANGLRARMNRRSCVFGLV